MSTSIYILRLQGGKKYVGVSDDPAKALISHKEGCDCEWTKRYPPSDVEKVYSFVPKEDLDRYVIECMKRFGIEHVRGGSWNTVDLNEKARRELYKRISQEKTPCCVQ